MHGRWPTEKYDVAVPSSTPVKPEIEEDDDGASECISRVPLVTDVLPSTAPFSLDLIPLTHTNVVDDPTHTVADGTPENVDTPPTDGQDPVGDLDEDGPDEEVVLGAFVPKV